MTDREVKGHLVFNPETGISEDGTMHDCVYRPRINQPKNEKKMTKQQAFKIVLEEMKKVDSFIGIFDAHGDNFKIMLGVEIVMDYIAFNAGDEDFMNKFYDNMLNSEESGR